VTISTLLEHVGVHVPRYVAIDGRIVLDPAPPIPSSPTPLAVSPHRFHGGEDPAPNRVNYADAWWNTDLNARDKDQAAMATYFPGFIQFGADGDYAYGGELNTGRGRFKILVCPQVDRSLPSVFPVHKNLGRPAGRQLQRPPHLYTSGALCIADAADWRPEQHSTATAVAWAAHWLCAFTEWRITGRWPAVGYGAAA
jgi:hypothetical protein